MLALGRVQPAWPPRIPQVLVELLSLGSGNSEFFEKILPDGGWFKNPNMGITVTVYTYIPHFLIIYMVGFLVEKTCVHINFGGMYT